MQQAWDWRQEGDLQACSESQGLGKLAELRRRPGAKQMRHH